MGVHVTASAITVRVQDAAGLSVGSSWVRVAVPQIVHVEQSGGVGSGDVVGPDSAVDGRPVVFDGTTGKKVRQGTISGPGGIVILGPTGTISDAQIPSSIPRDTDVTAAITAHTTADDPHGDRAHADTLVYDLAQDIADELDTVVRTDDPRLSDARTPTAHTHPATDIASTPATTGLAATNVEGALTELAARPSGSGGLWEVVSTQTLDATSPAVSFTGLEEFKEVEIRWSGRVTAANAQASYLQIQFNSDASTNYERSIFYRQSSFVSLNETAQTAGWVGRISGSQVNTNRRSFGTIYVPCDQPTGDHKVAYGDFACLASTSTQVAVGSAAVGWANTTDVITSLTLSPADGQFQTGCKFELLGRR